MKVKVIWDTHDCSVDDLECIDSLPTIVDVPNSVVHRIVISKELITCSDVVLIILQNIDEREII